MWAFGFFLVLVAVSTVHSKPVDVHGKDYGPLVDSLHEKLQKHFDEFDIPEGFKIGGSVAKSHAESASISGKGYHQESPSAATAKASAVSVAKSDDYHKHGGASAARAAAASKAVSADHYGKESVAKSAADAEAAAINLKKKEHKPEHVDEARYFKDQPQGDDPHAYFSGLKAAAAAESVAKSVDNKYHKGVSLAKSLAKSESFSGKGISASSVLAKSVSVSA